MSDRERYPLRVALATATLLVLIAGHAVRETARDALFLAGLPAERLPWAYLAIAVGAVAVGVLNRHMLGRFSHRLILVGTLAGAVAVDVGFWWIAAEPTAGALFGLYAWTGLLGTVVTLQLWLHLAEVFDVGETKRAFPWVAAGGLAGAVLGSVLAGALLWVIDTRSLLLASAVLLLVAASVANALPARTAPEPEELPARGMPLGKVVGSRYLRLITLVTLAVASMATGIDYLFKHAVAETVPTEDLGSFFALFHAAVNTAALATELLLASWLLRHQGVPRTLAILPAVACASAGALAAVGGFAATLALKVADGALRPSLFQASTEVLFQPLSAQARNAAKTAAESLGKRGGQALASLAILAAAGLELDPRGIGAGVAGLAAVALLAIRQLRGEYVARFRERLSGLAEEGRTHLPRLDLHSLEALLSNLSSPDESEALTSIELLERYDRASLISPLLLHHPSPRVVLRALEVLKRRAHPRLDGVLEHLLSHDDAEVRAGALNALVARGSQTAPIERMVHTDPSVSVRSTAVVALVARHDRPEEALAFLRGLLEDSGSEQRQAVARALPRLSPAVAAPIAQRLLDDGDPAPAVLLAQALSSEAAPDPDWIPVLIALLARRGSRPAARATLLRMGERALEALREALGDPDVPTAIRRHLPRTIHLFGTPAAAGILARHLESADPPVRYKILRGLGRMRADDPELEIPEEALEAEARRSLDRAVEMFALRVGYYVRTALAHVPRDPADDLLGRVLAEKEARALERVFRALHILDPRAEFDAIFEALRSPDRPVRAEGLELIEHVVNDGLRSGLLAMVGPEGAVERLRTAARSHGSDWARALARALPESGGEPSDPQREALAPVLEELLERLCGDGDPILAEIARRRLSRSADTAARVAEGQA